MIVSSVFHYTDAAGLLGILQSDNLFATDYRFLNDPSEGQILREMLLPLFETEIAEFTPKLIAKGWLKKKIYEKDGLSVHRLHAEGLYRALIQAVDNVSPFFVTSFCKHDDGSDAYSHGLLSQWRGYGGGGGFAIEFDEKELDELMFAEQRTNAYAGVKSESVRYKNHSTAFDPNHFKGLAGAMTRQIFEHVGIDATEVTGNKNIDAAVMEFAKLAPFLKHSGFAEECEYRMVGICLRRTKMPRAEKREVKPIKFRARNGLLSPYIEFLGNTGGLPIKGVIVGPHAFQQRQVDAVQMLAESYDLKLDIRRSELPYRT